MKLIKTQNGAKIINVQTYPSTDLFIYSLDMRAKGDWDFRISDLEKTLMELIFNPCGNFDEVRRAQLAKFTLLNSTLVRLGSFNDCSDAKDRVGCGKQPHLFIPSKTGAPVPELAVVDLPLSRTAGLGGEKDLPLDKIL